MSSSENTGSYVCGTSDEPLRYQTINSALDDACRRWGSREAVVVAHQGVRKTYTELQADVAAAAAGFVSLGLAVGDRVGIWSPNNYEWVITQLATARTGLVLVTINPAYRVHELEYVLNKVSCRALVLADRFKSSNYIEILQNLAPEIEHATPGALQAKKLPALEWVIRLGEETTPGMLSFNEVYVRADQSHHDFVDQLQGQLQPDDPINIQFTSGTTGSPKGATLSHCNILNNGRLTVARMQFTHEDRLCIPVPLYHCFGMVMGVLGCITQGACMVFPSDAFDPAVTLEVLEKEQCSACYGVPTMFIAMLQNPEFERYTLTSLRTGIMAGSPCPAEVMKEVNDKMHMGEITIAYGMTETSPVSFQSHVDDPTERRVSTVGRVHPHVEVKIIDEEGRLVRRGNKGELCTRGYCVMLGYWDDTERTREAIDAAGWMHTGDLAIIDEEGYCKIVGRVKDMIIRGGENIYPREIEEFLYTFEAIRDVAVFGVPDEKFGEQVCAWLQLNEGISLDEDTVKQFCREKIAHYKVPHYVKFVEEFPMTVTGKIQKFKMRDVMIEALELSSKRQ